MRTAQEVQQDLFEEELKVHNGNISRVARSLGINYIKAKEMASLQASKPFKPTLGPEPSDIRSVAKPGFEQYAIAYKRVAFEWPMKFDEIIRDARMKFNAGTHEIFQSNTTGWVVLYLIPRTTPVAPRKYFDV